MTDLIYKEESYRIVGSCFEVYQECLEIELALQGIPFKAQQELALSYKGQPLKQVYVPDFVCWEKIVVELKAIKALDDVHRAQVHNYLKATGHKLGLLINFGHYPKVEYERIVL